MESIKGLSSDELERIISEIQEKRFLWDKASSNYKDQKLKEITWNKIGILYSVTTTMAKRVLITGASGLLGRAIFQEFEKRASWEVLGLAFSRAGSKLKKVNLRDSAEVKKVIEEFKPSIIVHSAAERRPDVVEKQEEETRQLNIEATQTICECAVAVGAWVLFISTDYVFDGTKAPYTESDTPNPLNKYGHSKLNGETVTLSVNKDNGVIRIPILYGDIEYLGESAVTILFEKVLDATKDCTMSDYEKRYPTHCSHIAYIISELCEARNQDSSVKGIYHSSGDEEMTKFEMAVAMADVFNLPKEHIKGDRTPSAETPRPYDAHLACPRLKQLGIENPEKISFKSGIKEVLLPYLKK